jgi:hypothetical protein
MFSDETNLIVMLTQLKEKSFSPIFPEKELNTFT